MIKRILAGVCDPQYTASVARYSTEIAKRCSAEVTAISVTDIERLRNVGPVAIGGGTFANDLVSERIEMNDKAILQSLDILTRLCDEAEVPCHVVRAGGSPYKKLLDASRYHDLMVFGLRGLFEHGVIGEPPNELVQLIESGVHPVLAVGPNYRPVHRVLVAYSGSVESAKTVRNFIHLDLWPDAEVKVIHVGDSEDSGHALLTDISEYFAAHGRKVETELMEGSPNEVVLKQAGEWDAELIVVGNSAKSLIRRRVFGETALVAIRDSELPLFLSQERTKRKGHTLEQCN